MAARCLGRIPAHLKEEQRGRVARFLTGHAEQFAPGDFEIIAKQLLEVLDPDGSRSYDPDAHDRRSLTKAEDATGMLAGRFLLDQIGSAWFSAALHHYAKPEPAACGVDEHGQQTLTVTDTRSTAQRHADALVLMAKAALANAGQRGGEPPRVVVHTNPDQLADAAHHDDNDDAEPADETPSDDDSEPTDEPPPPTPRPSVASGAVRPGWPAASRPGRCRRSRSACCPATPSWNGARSARSGRSSTTAGPAASPPRPSAAPSRPATAAA